VKSSTSVRLCLPSKSAFAGFRLPAEVIVVAVRSYLRYNLSYRDVEELLVERGVEVDHVSVYRCDQATILGRVVAVVRKPNLGLQASRV
jgi:transposase-like protein